MLARNEVIFKWTLYALAATLCIAVQDALLQRISLWGVFPFVYPLLAAIPAVYEGPVPGTAFALAAGVVSDLLLPGPLPCFYTLAFPVCGLLAALLSRYAFPAGLFSCFLGSAITFAITDIFYCLLLWLQGQPFWPAGLWLMVREFCITVPLILPVMLLFRAVYRKVHIYD